MSRERILLAGFVLIVVLSGWTVVWPELSGGAGPSPAAGGSKGVTSGAAKPAVKSPGM